MQGVKGREQKTETERHTYTYTQSYIDRDPGKKEKA
jgi:hypothetical protein